MIILLCWCWVSWLLGVICASVALCFLVANLPVQKGG